MKILGPMQENSGIEEKVAAKFSDLNVSIEYFFLLQLISVSSLAVTLILAFFLLRNNFMVKAAYNKTIKMCYYWYCSYLLSIVIAILLSSCRFAISFTHLSRNERDELLQVYIPKIALSFIIALMNPSFIFCLLTVSIAFFLIIKFSYIEVKKERKDIKFKKMLANPVQTEDLNPLNSIKIKRKILSVLTMLLNIFILSSIYFFSRDYQIQQPAYLTSDQSLFIVSNILLMISITFY